MTAAEALDVLLRLLGVAPADAGGIQDRAGQYRSALAGKRMLVLLDNAADVEQVTPLIPGTGGCAAVVTSRRMLSTLPGTRHLRLDVLSDSEAFRLLTAIVGQDRVAAERGAALDVVRRCGHLPLAIRIAGARIVARSRWSISLMAERLADERRRLGELQHQDADVRTSLAVSLRQLAESDSPLDKEAIAAFPLLGLPDGPDLGIMVAARLLAKPERATEQILDRLVDSSLLEAPSPG